MTVVLDMPMQDDNATLVIDDVSALDRDGTTGVNTEDVSTDGPGDPLLKALTIPTQLEWGGVNISSAGGSPFGIIGGSVECFVRLSAATGLFKIFGQYYDLPGSSYEIDSDAMVLRLRSLNAATSLTFDLPPALDVTTYHKYVVVWDGNAGELFVDDVSSDTATAAAVPDSDFADFGFFATNLGSVDAEGDGPFDIAGLRVNDTATYPPSAPVVIFGASFPRGMNLTEVAIVADSEVVFTGFPTPTVSYQWQRANNSSGGGAANIATNGTSASYTPVAADIGKFNRRVTTGTNAGGSAVSNSSWVETFEAVDLPAASVIQGDFDDLAPFDGLFVIDDHTVSDTVSEEMPDPVVWESDSPQSAVDFSFHTVAVGAGRTNFSGATALSDSFCIAAKHAAPSGSVEFNTLAGVKTTRNISQAWDIVGDLRIIKLASTLPAGVMKSKILADSSAMAGKQCLAIECNRHLSRHTISESLTNDDSTLTLQAVGVDVIEGGDSSHAVFLLIGGVPVLVIGGFSSGSPAGGSSGINTAAFLAEISAILAASGEALTLVRLPGSPSSGSIRSSINSPIRSAIGNPFENDGEDD
jgi:hypothetical protein